MGSAVTQKWPPRRGGFQFPRDSGRTPLLGPGSLHRSCWVLHTHPPTKAQADPNPTKGLLPVGHEEKRLSYNVGVLGTVGHPASCSSLQSSYTGFSLSPRRSHLPRAALGLVGVTPSHLLQKGPWQGHACPFFPPLDSGDYLCHLNYAKPGPITMLQQLEDRNSPRNSPSCPHHAHRRSSGFSSAIRHQNQHLRAPSSGCL